MTQQLPTPSDAVRRACAAGVTTAWNGPCSATVDLTRLAGPRDDRLGAGQGHYLGLGGDGPWQLSDPGVRATLYSWVLTHGTQFDIYRWINLVDLAVVWSELDLPSGVHCEWQQVLLAAELLVMD